MDKGELVYEYNMMMIERYIGRSAAPLAAGKHRIVVETSIAKAAGPADVAISVDRGAAMHVAVKRTVAGAFSASETWMSASTLGRRCHSTISTGDHLHSPGIGTITSRSTLKGAVARCDGHVGLSQAAANPKSHRPRTSIHNRPLDV